MMIRTSKDSNSITKRAAEVRGNWSAQERKRRAGLPPDTPSKLREFFLMVRTNWPTVSHSS